MSLLRLLTAARSLENPRNDGGAYRLASQSVLPKFASKRNPFRENNGQAGARAAAGQPAPAAPAPMSPVLKTEEPPAPAATAAGGCAEETSRARHGTATAWSWLCQSVAKLGGWVRVRRRQAGAPARPRLLKGPVQGELLLANVRVVRNDLSDSDLEVVLARAPARAVSGASAARPRLGAGRVSEPAGGALAGAEKNPTERGS